MAESLVKSFATGEICLNYAGDTLVVMEPAPYANTGIINTSTFTNIITSGVGFAQGANDPLLPQSITIFMTADFFMMYNGVNPTLTFSFSAGLTPLSASYGFRVDGSIVGSSIPISAGANTITPPYYRYRIEAAMNVPPTDPNNPPASSWARFDIT